MKNRKLFWGLFFFTLGGLFLLGKINFFDTNWYFIWKIWPFIFILWGIAVLTKNTSYRQYVSAFFGLFLAILIYGSIANLTGLLKIDFADEGRSIRYNYYENLDSSVTHAELEISSGLATIIIKDTTDKLIYGTTYGSFGEYNFNREYYDSLIYLDFTHTGNSYSPFKGDWGNKLDIKLNNSILWDIELNLGVAKGYLDLRKFNISKVNLETGVTNIILMMGDKSSYSEVNVEMGVSMLEIHIPKSSGCKINYDLHITSSSLDGFSKGDGNNYYTENYDTSSSKIDIYVEGGVTSFEIIRY